MHINEVKRPAVGDNGAQEAGCEHKAVDSGEAEQVQGGNGSFTCKHPLKVHQCRKGSANVGKRTIRICIFLYGLCFGFTAKSPVFVDELERSSLFLHPSVILFKNCT
ncbi:GTP 3'8-cyclase [Dissostichus eleginoides]|uniref:GTP 3'8-cyclase n=1 Tax=Dissostichus eleginoides TaxID=100907 RepID=A0AAD9C2J9_DISEL|nr:GTP 3'8-cyclase [Dissostichus eleginoides]